MKMTVPPECQGQMVEVAYGWCDGELYRRVTDRSDRSVSWEVAEDASEVPETWHPVNGSPPVRLEWRSCSEPQEG